MEIKKYGAGGTTLLQIAFIVLKLTHVIEWSWLWVLAPLWITAIIAFICILICLACAIFNK